MNNTQPNYIPFDERAPLPSYMNRVDASAFNDDLIGHSPPQGLQERAVPTETKAPIKAISSKRDPKLTVIKLNYGDMYASELFGSDDDDEAKLEGFEASELDEEVDESKVIAEVLRTGAESQEINPVAAVFEKAEAEGEAARSAEAATTLKEHLSHFDNNHFKLKIGSDVYVCAESRDETGRHNLDTYKKNAFFDGHTHLQIVMQISETQTQTIYPAKVWFDKTPRSFMGGIVFKPDNSHTSSGPQMQYNLWKGWSLNPIPCDASVSIITEQYVHEVLCSGNRVESDFLLDSLAHLVQKPWERLGFATVLKGRKGTGKSTMAQLLRCFAGGYTFSTAQKKHIVGGFNAPLQNCLVLVAEEAMLAGDGQAESVLKDLITQPKMVIEGKFKDPITVDCYLRLFIFSNDSWVVPATDDERRFFVPTLSDHRMNDHAFWDDLYAYIDGDGAAMFLDFLKTRDISGFNPRTALETTGLKDQRGHSLALTYTMIINAMHAGEFRNDNGGAVPWQEGEDCVISKGVFLEMVRREHRNTKYTGNAPSTSALNKLLQTIGIATKRGDSGTRSSIAGKQEEVYTFPHKRKLADQMIEVLKVSPEDFEGIG